MSVTTLRRASEIAPWSVIFLTRSSQGFEWTKLHFWWSEKMIFSHIFQFPLEFPDAANNKDRNRCSSLARLSADSKVFPFLCATTLERIALKGKLSMQKNIITNYGFDGEQTTAKKTGNFIKNSTRKTLVSETFHFSDDETGRKLTGKDL